MAETATSPMPQAKPGRKRPRDAASLLVIDRSAGTPRVLLGRRNPRQEFVPDKYVFPGGRLEAADSRLSLADELRPRDLELLMRDMKGRTSQARANGLALAAIRETYEETGTLIGEACQPRQISRDKTWAPFLSSGVEPRPSKLHFVARAITPPGRSRRYDTRFFIVFADEIVREERARDGEFTEIVWATFDEARLLDLHAMTRTVLDDTEDWLSLSPAEAIAAPVPYYYSRNGHFRRELLCLESLS